MLITYIRWFSLSLKKVLVPDKVFWFCIYSFLRYWTLNPLQLLKTRPVFANPRDLISEETSRPGESFRRINPRDVFKRQACIKKKKAYKNAYIQGKCISVILFRLQCLPSYTSKCLSYWYNYIFMVNMIICTIHLKRVFESSLNCSRISMKNTLDELRSLAWLRMSLISDVCWNLSNTDR